MTERIETGVDQRATLREAVAAAILAPSGHNTQPWRFRIGPDWIELRADRRRSLPVVDPDDRELTISCGAALFHLLLALRHAGLSSNVTLTPDPADPDLLARLEIGEATGPTVEDISLFTAIPARRTNRKPFGSRPLPEGFVEAMRESAEREGAWLAPVEGERRQAVGTLIEEGARIQWRDRRFRAELATWMRPARRGDGLTEQYLFGLGPLSVRVLDLGRSIGRKDRELATHAPLLVVLGTAGDAVSDRLRAGQALARALLRAAADGVDASFFNQPVEVEALRPRLAEAVGVDGWPQVVLRFGYGPAVPASPRRPLGEVLEEV